MLLRLLNILTFPPKFIKINSDILSVVSINSSIKSSLFPSCLETADITLICWKGKRDLKDNYKPVRILPVLSKLHERSMWKQISEFFHFQHFLKSQCGFMKSQDTQQCILAMLEKWKRSMDSSGLLLLDLQTYLRHLTASTMSF